MAQFVSWIQQFIRELRRRRVLRVAAVYVTSGYVLLELGEILVEPFGLPGWTIRMVTFVLILGFPLAVGLAWVFDVTEEGLIRTESAEEEAPPRDFSFSSHSVLAGLLIVAIGVLLYPLLFSSGEDALDTTQASAPAVDERSIAVLPFDALGEEPGPFTEGIHDDLLTRLSNVGDLQVISRTSVRKYRDTELSVPAIADSLGVRWILEGGVLQSGGQVQVNAQLIDPGTDAHVWADRYQRELTAENLFGIQGEIAAEIAEALQTELTAGEQERMARAPTEDLDAYRLYVKGRGHLDSRTAEGIRRAIDYFQEALTEDSTFALAWVGLADARGLSPTYGSDSLDASVPSQEEAARRALELAPELAEAHASMGFFHYRQQNGPAALRQLRRAVELKPSYAQAHHWLGNLQLLRGQLERGLDHVTRAVGLDPQHRAANRVLVTAYLFNGQEENAFKQAQRIQNMDFGLDGAIYQTMALHHLGHLEKAQEVAERELSAADTSMQKMTLWGMLALSEAADGDTRRARRQLDRIQETPFFPLRPFFRGMLHVALGNTGSALKAFREDREWWGNIANVSLLRYLYPGLLGELREDPRYEELIREIDRYWEFNRPNRFR